MSETVVRHVYTFRCLRCGSSWTEDMEVIVGLEYVPPRVPHRCPSCEGDLLGETHAWTRQFEVSEVRTYD